MKPAPRFARKSAPTRDYHLSAYVSEVSFNSHKDEARFAAVVAGVRKKAADRRFNAAQMAELENAIAVAMAGRERAA